MEYDKFRHTVGKAYFRETKLEFGEWSRVGIHLEGTLGGCNHGNCVMPPPNWGTYDGYNAWFAEPVAVNPYGVICFVGKPEMLFNNMVNFYIGRTSENGQPWLASGNSISFRIMRHMSVEGHIKQLYETEILSNNQEGLEKTEITGPINFSDAMNLEVSGNTNYGWPYLTCDLKLDGVEESNQDDIYVLGGKTGYWSLEGMHPLWRSNT